MTKKKTPIGFVGQGYVGGSYANNFEKRGYSATTIETTESRQKWHCYDGGTTAVNVFETNFAFKLLQR